MLSVDPVLPRVSRPTRKSARTAAFLFTALMLIPALAAPVLATGTEADPVPPATDSGTLPHFSERGERGYDPALIVQQTLQRVLTPDELALVELAKEDPRTLAEQVAFLQATARVLGDPVALPYRHALDPHAPLRVALMEAGLELGSPTPLLNEDIASAADRVPLDYQRALALLLYAASEPRASPDGVGRMALVASALEQSLPVLTKYRLLGEITERYRNRALGIHDPVDPLTAAGYRAEAARLEGARLLPRGETGTSFLSTPLLGLAGQHGIVPAGPVDAVTGSKHDLVEELLVLYALEGVVADPLDVAAMRADAGKLPVNVARAAANILHAMNAAAVLQRQALAGLTDEDIRFLEASSDDVARIAAADGATADDLLLLARYARLLGAFDAPRMLQASLLVANTLEANLPLLRADPQPPLSALQRFWASLEGILPVMTASAQTIPDPRDRVPTGDNDIAFVDPVLKAVIISGFGTTRYDERYAAGRQVLTIDLGGNDVYLNNQGGAIPRGGISFGNLLGGNFNNLPVPVAVSIDVAGNDQYRGPNRDTFLGTAGQGAGFLGIGVLLDAAGDDTYEAYADPIGQSNAQASAFLGAGILADLGGSDSYKAEGALAQGAAGLYGIALLLDLQQSGASGTAADIYDAKDRSQAYAAALTFFSAFQVEVRGGFAMAALVDEAGDDRYVAGSRSQGAADNATAFLVDGAGSDRYQAAESSQGALYRHPQGRSPFIPSAAVLIDLGAGSDTFKSTSYGMGANYGMLLNLGEDDDVYDASGNSTQGFSGGLLLDLGGNDRYTARGVTDNDARKGGSAYIDGSDATHPHEGATAERFTYAQGSSGPLHTGGAAGFYPIGILVDLAGDDAYWSAGGRSQGWNDTYLNGTHHVAGLLVDRFGNDRYEAGSSLDPTIGRRNEKQGSDSQNMVVDLAGTDIYTNPVRGNDKGLDYSDDNSDGQQSADLRSWDFYTDYLENTLGSDPKDPRDTPVSDADGDGFPTWLERMRGPWAEAIDRALIPFQPALKQAGVSTREYLAPTDPNDPESNPSRIYAAFSCDRNVYATGLVVLMDICAGGSTFPSKSEACPGAFARRGDLYRGNATLTPLLLDVGGDDCHDGGAYALSRGLALNLFGSDQYRGGARSLNSILDYEGDDKYLSTGPNSQNGIVDLALTDADRFVAQDASQASFPRFTSTPASTNPTAGSAFLLNFGMKGNTFNTTTRRFQENPDVFVAHNNSQAAFAHSVGGPLALAGGHALLFNANGRAEFTARNHSQGAVNGVTHATALLITGAGSCGAPHTSSKARDRVAAAAPDAMACTAPVDYRGLDPDVDPTYATFGADPGTNYNAFFASQGAVTALNYTSTAEVSNSLALLLDLDGNDTYVAGPYSQASVGRGSVVRNTQTNRDEIGRVTQSVALLLDAAGKDTYFNIPLVHQLPTLTASRTADTARFPTGPLEGRSLGYAETGYLNGTGDSANLGTNQDPNPSTGDVRAKVNLAAAIDLGDGDDQYFALRDSLGAARGARSTAAVINARGHDTYLGGHGSMGNTTAWSNALFLDGDGDDRYFLAGTTLVQHGDVADLQESLLGLPLGPDVPALQGYLVDHLLQGYLLGTFSDYVQDYVLGDYPKQVADSVNLSWIYPLPFDPVDIVSRGTVIWNTVIDNLSKVDQVESPGIVCPAYASPQETVALLTTVSDAHKLAPDTKTRVCYDTSGFPHEVKYWVYYWNSSYNASDPRNSVPNPDEGSIVRGSFRITREGVVWANMTVDRNDTREFYAYGQGMCSPKLTGVYSVPGYRALCGSPANPSHQHWPKIAGPYNDTAKAVPITPLRTQVPLCAPMAVALPFCVVTFTTPYVPELHPQTPDPDAPDAPGTPDSPPTGVGNPGSAPGTVPGYTGNQTEALLRFFSATPGPGNNRVWVNEGLFDNLEAARTGLALGIDSPIRFATATAFNARYADISLTDLTPLAASIDAVSDASGNDDPFAGLLQVDVRVAYETDVPFDLTQFDSVPRPGLVDRVEIVAAPPHHNLTDVVAARASGVLGLFTPGTPVVPVPWNTTTYHEEWTLVDGEWQRIAPRNESYAWDAARKSWTHVPAQGQAWSPLDGTHTLAARAYSLIRYANDGSAPGDPVTWDGVGSREDVSTFANRSEPRDILLANDGRVLAVAYLTDAGTPTPTCPRPADAAARILCFSPGALGVATENDAPGRTGTGPLRLDGLLSAPLAQGAHLVVSTTADGPANRTIPLTVDPATVDYLGTSRNLARFTVLWDGKDDAGAPLREGTYNVSLVLGDGPRLFTRAVLLDRTMPISTLTGKSASNSTSFLITWAPVTGTRDATAENFTVEYREYAADGTAVVGAWTSICARATTLSALCPGGRAPAGGPLTSARFNGAQNHTYHFRSLARDDAGNWERKTHADLIVLVDNALPVSSLTAPAVTATEIVHTTSRFPSIDLAWTATDEGSGVAAVRVEACDLSRSPCDPAANWTLLALVPGASGRTSFEGAEDGRTYRFRTIAIDHAGNVEAFGRKPFYVEVTVDLYPATVSGLTVSDASHRSALVKWTTTEPTSGRIVLTPLDGPTLRAPVTLTLPPTLRTTHEVLVTDLFPGTTYRATVFSRDAAGNENPGVTNATTSFATLHLLSGQFQYPTEGALLHDTTILRWSGIHATGANVTYQPRILDLDTGLPVGAAALFPAVTAPAGPVDTYRTLEIDTFRLGRDCTRCVVEVTLSTSEETLVIRSGEFSIDNFAPVVTVDTGGVAETPSGWFNRTLHVRLDAEDAGAGVKARYYSTTSANLFDPANRTVYEDPFTLHDGVHVLRYYAEDHAGRESPLTERILRIDTTAPKVESFTTSASRITTREVLVRIAADDGAGSGVKDMRLRIDGGAWTAWEDFRPALLLTLPGGDGQKSIEVELRDAAGNANARGLLMVTLDTTRPTVTTIQAVRGADSATLTWNTDEATRGDLRLTAPDGRVSRFTSATPALRHVLTFPGLTPGGTYAIELRVTDEVGLKGAVTLLNFTLDVDEEAPEAVTALRASVTDGRVVLTWDAGRDNIGVLAYRVYRVPAGSPDAERVRLAETPALSFIDLDAPGERFRYLVSALDAQGNEGPASAVEINAPGAAGFESISMTPERAIGTTPVVFQATFRDDGRGAPVGVVLVIANDRHWMTPGTPTPDGALVYTVTVTLPGLNLTSKRYEYHVEALYEETTYRYPASGDLPGPLVINAALTESEDDSGFASFFTKLREVPATGVPDIFAAFIAVAAGTLLIRSAARRGKNQ